jgi:hypothetical protein
MLCIGQSAQQARESIRLLNEGPNETHFIRIHRTPLANNKNSRPTGHGIARSEPLAVPEINKTPIPIQGQLIIQWDGATLRVEAPGRNGSRQKVEGVYLSDLPLEMQHSLLSQVEDARDRNRAELLATQRENIAYVAGARGMGVEFARQIWPSATITSRTMRARLAKAGQYDPISGKIRGETKPQKEILDLDL